MIPGTTTVTVPGSSTVKRSVRSQSGAMTQPIPAGELRLSVRRWSRADFSADATTLARNLLGALLVRVLPTGETLAGRIVETEAYCGVIDAASHAFRGRRTPRNEAMYAQPGTAYVYFTYGMHYCLNVVCGELDEPLAVLIRALEPIAGLDTMRVNRGFRENARDRDLCSGPARLCQALDIARHENGLDLVTSPRVYIAHTTPPAKPAPRLIRRAPRIGIAYAGEWADKPLRFCLAASDHLSKPIPKPIKLVKRGKSRKPANTTGNRTLR